MEIYLNEKQLDNSNFEGLSSIEDIFNEVRNDLADEVIAQIFLNGVEVHEEYLVNSDYSREDISTLKFVTKDVRPLVIDTLKQAQDYLPTLKEGVLDTADLFRQGNREEGNQKYQLCLEGIQWYIGVLDNILTLVDDQEITKNGNEMINEFNGLLKELVISFENDDMVLVADLLEYEITEFINEFLELNDEIISLIKDS